MKTALNVGPHATIARKKGHVSSVCRSKIVQVVHVNDVNDDSIFFVNSTLSSANKLYIDGQMLKKDVHMQGWARQPP